MNLLMKAVKHPDKIITNLGRRGFLNWMTDKQYISILYNLTFRKKPELECPATFNEKMQYLKLHDRKAAYTAMVDKYAAKEYVDSTAGKEFVIGNLGTWNSFDDIDFDALPNQFVLKCTHDSSGLVICKDKSKFDARKAREKINRCLNWNFFYFAREWPYKDVKPRIIAEEYLENSDEGLHDYKIWCFNGEPKYVQYISGRLCPGGGNDVTKEAFYDPEWNKQNFTYHNPLLDYDVPKPKRLDEMLDFARKFSKGIPFLRVDLYVLEDDSIRFGEFTFYPMSGFERFHPDEMDLKFGQMLDISSVK